MGRGWEGRGGEGRRGGIRFLTSKKLIPSDVGSLFFLVLIIKWT